MGLSTLTFNISERLCCRRNPSYQELGLLLKTVGDEEVPEVAPDVPVGSAPVPVGPEVPDDPPDPEPEPPVPVGL